jgi:Uma2 family endonuclease
VLRLGAALLANCDRYGGKVYVAPRDVFFTDRNVVEPDVIYVWPEELDRNEERVTRGAPTLVVEVSSPSTRHLELVRKKELYARFGVPEYWYVDLDAERVEVYRFEAGGYGIPQMLGRDAELSSPLIPGFSIATSELLGSS